MLKCNKCYQEKEITDFYKNQKKCKECHKVYVKDYIKRKPEIRKKSLENWRKKYIEKFCKICGNKFIADSISYVCSLKCRILEGCKKQNDCWIWIKGKAGNYGKTIWKQKMISAHRASYIAFKGKIDSKINVCHSCDNPLCVNPDHLWLGTYKENMQDCRKKGRLAVQWGRKHSEETKLKFKNRPHSDRRGEKHHLKKITENDVKEIRKLGQKKIKQKEIALRYGVHASQISNILLRKAWSHI